MRWNQTRGSTPLQVESAKKLRWYDRDDLSHIVESNLKDKKLLQSTISALRQVCCREFPLGDRTIRARS